MPTANSLQASNADERRLLHYTMKITNRLATKDFVCNILGMKVLRHSEMDSGCAAQCNGNYQSPWSKTMAGYGDENSFFALELNYNYDVEGYAYGNDFSSLTIHSRQAVANARQNPKLIEVDNKKSITVRSPDGHRFILVDEDVPAGADPVRCLSLNVSDLKKSVNYYTHLLKFKVNEKESSGKQAKLYYGLKTDQEAKVKSQHGFLLDNQTQLELIGLDQPIDRGTGYGRKAISCALVDVDILQQVMEKEGNTVLIPAMNLGGALDPKQVRVVILQDPDGHEICFVGEEGYIKACESDPEGDKDFYKGLNNTPDEPTKYLIGEDESSKPHDKK